MNQALPVDLKAVSLFIAGHKIADAKATSFSFEGDTGKVTFDLPRTINDDTVVFGMRKGDPMPLSVAFKSDQKGDQIIASRAKITLVEPPRVIKASTDAKSARFDRPIEITVVGLKDWIESQKRIDPATGDDAHIRLFLAEHELIGVTPKITDDPDGTSRLSFDPNSQTVPDSRQAEDRAGWVSVVSIIRRKEPLPATIGIEKSSRLLPSDAMIQVKLYSAGIWFALGLIPVLAGAMVVLGKKSDLLREEQRDGLPEGERSRFSLGRCQMACWFFLVIGAYIYITFTYGDPPPITSTILVLIGISAGTGLAAAVIDNSQRNDGIKQAQDLKTQADALTARIGALKQLLPAPALVPQPVAGGAAAAPAPDPLTTAANVPALQEELRNKTGELADLKARMANLPSQASKGFFKDLVREGSSVSFHRFQIAVWTIVLAIIFIRSVWQDLAMPEFDTTLLGLMGISSGTYLGFKIPDKPMSSASGN